jgi:hypothetical protein
LAKSAVKFAHYVVVGPASGVLFMVEGRVSV